MARPTTKPVMGVDVQPKETTMSDFTRTLLTLADVVEFLKTRSHWDQGNGIEVTNYEDVIEEAQEDLFEGRPRPSTIQTTGWAVFAPSGGVVWRSFETNKRASIMKVLSGQPHLTEAHFWAAWKEMTALGYACVELEWTPRPVTT